MYNQQQQNNNYGQQAPQQPNTPLPSLDSVMQGGSAHSYFTGDSPVGASVKGEVVSVDLMQIHEFGTTQLAYWPDGKPKTQIHIVLQTTLNEDADDDGRRSLWIKTWGVQMKALREACRLANVKAPEPGDTMSMTFTGLGERGKAPQPPKMYAFTIEHTSAAAAAINAPQPMQQQPAAQPPQQPFQQAAQQAAAAATYAQVPQQQTQQPMTPAFDAQQVRQFAVLGKNLPEIAAMTGARPDQIQPILDQVHAAQQPQQDEPPF